MKTKMQTSVIKKTLLLALILVTGSAWAGWVPAWSGGGGVFYIDPETIRKDGNLVRVWTIYDEKRRHKDGQLSIRSREEYDCKQERYRYLSMSTHSEPMARGDTLESYPPDVSWREIPPGGAASFMLKIVCR